MQLRMDGSTWEIEWNVSNRSEIEVEYNFVVLRGGEMVRVEPPTMPHHLRFSPGQTRRDILIEERWIDPHPLHRLSREPLAEWLRRENDELLTYPRWRAGSSYAVVRTPYVEELYGNLFLVGDSPEFGEWDPHQGVPLSLSRSGFSVEMPPDKSLEFKLVYISDEGVVEWEQGPNRRWNGRKVSPKAIEAVYLEPPVFAGVESRVQYPHFKGTAVPLFSLRSESSYGCGDFQDAQLFLRWLHRSGQRVLQLLPIYDTNFHYSAADSYPYDCISTFGINPIYLDVRRLPHYIESDERKAWEAEARRLNALTAVDYMSVKRLKDHVIDHSFGLWYPSRNEDEGFQSFFARYQDQLLPYALFCVYRDRHPGVPVAEYPALEGCMKQWKDAETMEGVSVSASVYRYLYVQYQLYSQLSELRREAERLQIILKGDLPIGVGMNSVEVWQDPTLFHTSLLAGAPPDAFSTVGQCWGFPTYNWEKMREDGYQWWRRRLQTMDRYFSAVRIDHILGFFRIWSIPVHAVNPCVGYFVPSIGYSEEVVRERLGVEEIESLLTPLLSPAVAEEIWGELLEEALKVHCLEKISDFYRWLSIDPDQIPERLRDAYRRTSGEVFLVKDQEGILHPRVMPSQTYRIRELEPSLRDRIYALHDEYFYHRNEDLWRSTALERLYTLVRGTDMLVCAEDLGMVPGVVPQVLHDLEILSLEVVRMPKGPGSAIVRPSEIPYLSVITTSTHDTASLRGWWMGLSDEIKHEVAANYPDPDGGTDPSPEGLVRGLSRTSALLRILPLQDWFVLTGHGKDVSPELEQINRPEEPHHVWSYRMPGTLESLLGDEPLISAIVRL